MNQRSRSGSGREEHDRHGTNEGTEGGGRVISIKPRTVAKIAPAKKAMFRFAVVALIVVNAMVILPGVVFAVVLNQYTPAVAAVVMSLAVWVASRMLAVAIRGGRRAKQADRSRSREEAQA
ncbi:hypothetical protein [Streptomyces sp. NPDC055036]